MKTHNNYQTFFTVKGVKRLVLPCLLAALAVVLCSFPCFSQEPSASIMENLFNNPKINFPDAVLQDFMDGKSTTRVIVNLHDAIGWSQDLSAGRGPVRSNFNDTNVRQQVQAEVQSAQDRVIDTLDGADVRITNRFTYIFGFSAEVTPQGLQALTDNGDVFSIDEDMILQAHLAQGIPLMNASTVRNTYNGSGMAIAICDTGIDYTHPMLGNGGFPNTKVIGGYDTGQNDSNPMDGNGHGTSCAGIAAGDVTNTGDYIGGVAYNAKLYALKMTYTATDGSAYTADMVEAWEWCVTHQNDNAIYPIMIISTSFGGGRYYNQSTCDALSTSMTTAASNAKAAGITIFVSTGNDGFCDSAGWPGCLTDVIGVGAVYDAAFGTHYPCVNAGSCATKYPTGGCSTGYYAIDNTAADMVTSYSNSASFMSLFAPSNQAYTTDIVGAGGYDPGSYYSSFGGTSAACPYAAGAGAVLQSTATAMTGSYLTPDQVESYLVNYGDNVTDGKVTITKPRVNLGNAVNELSRVHLSNELAMDFGFTGLWDVDISGTWNQLSGGNVETMTGWDNGLAMDFGGSGLWNVAPGGAWSQLSRADAENVAAWDNGLAMDFGASGLWNVTTTGTWSQISESNVETMAGWGNGLAMDFGGSGLWNVAPGGAWSQLSRADAENVAAWDNGLAFDFGASGLWNVTTTGTWSQISGSNVETMAGWDNGLAMDFGGSGLWNVAPGGAWSQLSRADAENVAAWDNGLAMDFGGSGLWNVTTTGTWSQISGADAEGLTDVNLY